MISSRFVDSLPAVAGHGSRQRFVRGWVLGALALLALSAVPARAVETSAPTAILVDFNTGTVLFEKNADEQIPPASLAKLMTVDVIFHELAEGRIALDDMFTVSEHAWRTGGAASGGSTMFLPLDSQVQVGDLIKGIIIQSGNDASIVAAEGIGGSEASFAEMMNRRAEAIGLTNSHFTNPHGLPDPEQHVTVRDLALLAAHLVRDHPDQYGLFREEEYTFNGIKQRNRNPLLGLGLGADGLKTGHTSEAGYGLVASGEQKGRRLVLAMSGMKSTKEREDQARQLMGWGFTAFEEAVLIAAGQTAGQAEVQGGEQPGVPLVVQEDVRMLRERGNEGEFQLAVAGNAAVEAPVAKGAQIGTLQVLKDGAAVREVPLFAASAVEQAPLLSRMWDALVGMVW